MLKSSPIVQQNNPIRNDPEVLQEMIPRLDAGLVSRGLGSRSQPCPARQPELRHCAAGRLSTVWLSFPVRSQVPAGKESHHLSVQHLTQELEVNN